jgi:glycosyltransferase involved in cell wall biosynthesis
VARRAGVVARVHLHDYVDDDRLAAFYRQATAFAWLSSYEGFGLPPLEALAAGVPGLVLDTPVAREVMADAATYVADVAPASIAAGLERVLFDEAERRRVYAASAAVLRRHSWRACATTVLRALTAAA